MASQLIPLSTPARRPSIVVRRGHGSSSRPRPQPQGLRPQLELPRASCLPRRATTGDLHLSRRNTNTAVPGLSTAERHRARALDFSSRIAGDRGKREVEVVDRTIFLGHRGCSTVHPMWTAWKQGEELPWTRPPAVAPSYNVPHRRSIVPSFAYPWTRHDSHLQRAGLPQEK